MKIGRFKDNIKNIKRDTYALYLAARDPGTPWYAKALVIIVIGYALSPVDLIPDFIPFIGQLDDLIIVPIGIWIATKLIPDEIMKRCKEEAEIRFQSPKKSKAAGIIVILIWIAASALIGYLIYRAFHR